jgi:hypothetical protein
MEDGKRSFEVDQQIMFQSAREFMIQFGKTEGVLEDKIKRRNTMLGSWGRPAKWPRWGKASERQVQTMQTDSISINDGRSCASPTPEKDEPPTPRGGLPRKCGLRVKG